MRLRLVRAQVAVRRRGPRRGFALLLFVGGSALFAMTLGGGAAALQMGLVAMALILAGIGVMASASGDLGDGQGQWATVSVAADRIEVTSASGASKSWPLSRLQGGWRQGLGDDDPVVLRFSTGTSLTIWPGATEEAEALLVATTGERSARFLLEPAGLRTARYWFSLAVVMLTPMVSVASVLLLGVTELAEAVGVIGLLLAASTLLLAFLHRTLPLPGVVVGSEGLAWGPFGHRRISHRDIARVERFEANVLLKLPTGSEVLEAVNVEVAAALCDRIEEARGAFDRTPPSQDWARLARAGRSVPEWREDLGRLLDDGGYRAGAMSADTLLRIAEDARAEPERRVAASIALASTGQRHRQLRVAAERSAHPALRLALGRAAQGELDVHALEAAHRAHEQTVDGRG